MYLLAQTEILKCGSNNITLYSILRGFLLVPENKNQFMYKFFFHIFPIFFQASGKKLKSTTKLKEKMSLFLCLPTNSFWLVAVAQCNNRVSEGKKPLKSVQLLVSKESSRQAQAQFLEVYSDSVIVAKWKGMIGRHERTLFCCLIHIQGTAETFMLNWILIRAGFGPKRHFKTIQTDGST